MTAKGFTNPHVAAAVAVTAAVCSSKVRAVLRQGAVYGLAGAFKVGDALAAFARGVARGAQQAMAASPEQPASAAGHAAAEQFRNENAAAEGQDERLSAEVTAPLNPQSHS